MKVLFQVYFQLPILKNKLRAEFSRYNNTVKHNVSTFALNTVDVEGLSGREAACIGAQFSRATGKRFLE